MTDQEFREIRSMVQRRVRERHALGQARKKRGLPIVAKKRSNERTAERERYER